MRNVALTSGISSGNIKPIKALGKLKELCKKSAGMECVMGQFIYLDHAATTAARKEVVEAMLPYFTEQFGNPSSVYGFAAKNKIAIQKVRERIADSLGAKKEEIYFTAGGSEADNWALKSIAEMYRGKGNHIITTKIEHHAILHTFLPCNTFAATRKSSIRPFVQEPITT